MNVQVVTHSFLLIAAPSHGHSFSRQESPCPSHDARALSPPPHGRCVGSLEGSAGADAERAGELLQPAAGRESGVPGPGPLHHDAEGAAAHADRDHVDGPGCPQSANEGK